MKIRSESNLKKIAKMTYLFLYQLDNYLPGLGFDVFRFYI